MKISSLMASLFKAGVILGPLLGFALHYHYHLGIVQSGWDELYAGLEILPRTCKLLLIALNNLLNFLLLGLIIVAAWLITIPAIIIKRKLGSTRLVSKISLPIGCSWTVASFYFFQSKLASSLSLFLNFLTLGCQLLFSALYLIVLGFVTVTLGYIMMVSGILIVINRFTPSLKNGLLKMFSIFQIKKSSTIKGERKE